MIATLDAPVVLVVPADPSFLRVARLVVSSLAADLNFGIDDIENVRIVTDELLSALISATEGESRLHIIFTTSDGSVTMNASISGMQTSVALDPLAEQIVSSLVDDYELRSETDEIRATFRSRQSEVPDRVG